METTKEQVGAVLSAGGTHTIGALVFWSLAGARVPRDTFRAALGELGLGSALGRDPTRRGALAKALTATFTGRRAVLARRLANGDAAVVLERLTAGKADYRHVVTLSHSRGANDVVVGADGPTVQYVGDTPEEQQASAEALLAAAPTLLTDLGTAYDDAMMYLDTQDMSDVLTTAVNGSPHRGLLAGLSLRERTGGLYFLAAAHVEKMQRLRHLIQDVAPACVISVMTITGNDENLAQAARVAKMTFAAQLDELRTELTEFHAGLQAKDKRASGFSIETRIDRYRELAAKVAVFRDLLGVSELEQQVKAAQDEMLQLLEAP